MFQMRAGRRTLGKFNGELKKGAFYASQLDIVDHRDNRADYRGLTAPLSRFVEGGFPPFIPSLTPSPLAPFTIEGKDSEAVFIHLWLPLKLLIPGTAREIMKRRTVGLAEDVISDYGKPYLFIKPTLTLKLGYAPCNSAHIPTPSQPPQS